MRTAAKQMGADLMAVMCRCREVTSSSEREVRLSPSMMAREIQRTHPVAPVFQSPMGPGAHPLCRATGPSNPYPMSCRATSAHALGNLHEVRCSCRNVSHNAADAELGIGASGGLSMISVWAVDIGCLCTAYMAACATWQPRCNLSVSPCPFGDAHFTVMSRSSSSS